MNNTVYVGIDPGVTGAIAALFPDNEDEEVWIEDTPNKEIHIGKNVRKEYDLFRLHKIVEEMLTEYGPTTVAIERVGVLPTDGRVGAFSFGKGYGQWLGILGCLGVPVVEVSPLIWKRSFGILGSNKDESRRVAGELFPSISETHLSRVKDHNRAEALLIAEWLRRQDKSNQTKPRLSSRNVQLS